MKHVSELKLVDLYNYSLDNFKESPFFKNLKLHKEMAPESKINPEKDIKFRLTVFNSIKKNGLLKPIKVKKKYGKYFVIEGGGRATSCFFLSIKAKIILDDGNDMGFYLNEDEVEIK